MAGDKHVPATDDILRVLGGMLAEDLCYDELVRAGRYYFGVLWNPGEFKQAAREQARQFAREFAARQGWIYEPEGRANAVHDASGLLRHESDTGIFGSGLNNRRAQSNEFVSILERSSSED